MYNTYNQRSLSIAMRDMAIGDLAVDATAATTGAVYLRTLDGVVDLNDPFRTWAFEDPNLGPTLPVRVLPPGEVVTLTVR